MNADEDLSYRFIGFSLSRSEPNKLQLDFLWFYSAVKSTIRHWILEDCLNFRSLIAKYNHVTSSLKLLVCQMQQQDFGNCSHWTVHHKRPKSAVRLNPPECSDWTRICVHHVLQFLHRHRSWCFPGLRMSRVEYSLGFIPGSKTVGIKTQG